MKRIKALLSALLIVALTLTMASCFVISGQKMRSLKGTYKLTNYTYTPSHERRDGYTPKTYDYVNDEAYKYEDYLIITGTGSGYYVHKDASGEAYVKEITLSYEYDEEGKSKIEYVIHNDSLSMNSTESGTHRLGVNKKVLNYSKAALDYTQLITKKPMRTESLSVRWEKVSRATDLSYVKEQLGDLKEYDYQSFAKRGIYELTPQDIPEEITAPIYKYLYVVIDTAKDAYTATAYYALTDSDEQLTKTLTVSRSADDWSSFTLDGYVWSVQAMTNSIYTVEYDGIGYSCMQVGYGIAKSDIDELIATKLDMQS